MTHVFKGLANLANESKKKRGTRTYSGSNLSVAIWCEAVKSIDRTIYGNI